MQGNMRLGTAVRAGAALLLAAALLAACTDLPKAGTPVQATMPAAGVAARELTITQEQEVAVSSSYRRTLKAGSHWRYFGSLAQGEIYRPTDTPFPVESANVHEAYLVLSAGSLVGYSLPVEQVFLPLAP